MTSKDGEISPQQGAALQQALVACPHSDLRSAASELAAWDSVRSHVLRAQSPRLSPHQPHPQVVASLASEWPAVNWGSISMPGRRAHRTQGNIVATFTCSKEMISLKAGIRMRGSVGWDLQESRVFEFVFLGSWRAGTATLLAYSWVLTFQQASSSSTV